MDLRGRPHRHDDHVLIVVPGRGLRRRERPNGPVILAPNHASFMDHFFAGAFIRRHVQFMAKSQMFGNNPLSWVFSHGGVFPVRRGNHDEDAFTTAFSILDRGGVVGMYSRAGAPGPGELGEAKAGHRPARARVGRPGRAGRDPRLKPGPATGSAAAFPKVHVQYGPPLAFERVQDSSRRDQQQRAADEILERIEAMHTELRARGCGTACCDVPLSRRVGRAPRATSQISSSTCRARAR